MTVFVCSDIHGYFDPWMTALQKAGFRPEDGHRLIVIGDIIDRGPKSKECYLYMKDLLDKYPEQIQYIRGNHDQMFLDFLRAKSPIDRKMAGDHWFLNGGMETVRSFLGEDMVFEGQTYDNIQMKFLEEYEGIQEFFAGLPFYYVKDDAVFVHAGFRSGVPLAEQDEMDMLWIRDDFLSGFTPAEGDVLENKWIIHGHTPVIYLPDYNGEGIYIKGNRINIDGGCAAARELFVIEWPGLKTTIVPVQVQKTEEQK